MNCWGSGFLSEGMPEKTSKYADEGTLAHAMAEAFLTGKAFDETDCPEGMAENVAVYVNHILELKGEPEAVCHVEQQVKITENCWGTSDATVWAPKS